MLWRGWGEAAGREMKGLYCFLIYLLAVLGLRCRSGLAAVNGGYSSCGATPIAAVSLVEHWL